VCDANRCSRDELLTECSECGGEYCNRHIPPAKHDCREPEAEVDATLYEDVTPSVSARKLALTLFAVVLLAGVLWLSIGVISKEGIPKEAKETATDVAVDLIESPPITEGYNRTKVERRVHYYINQEREKQGLPRLSFDTELREIARGHSSDMAKREYFAHESPSGADMEDRYENAGYRCRTIKSRTGSRTVYAAGGENIAQTYWQQEIVTESGDTKYFDTNDELARGIVEQWMNSPRHRKNILQPYWNSEGIGLYKKNQQIYATQNFC